MATFILNTFHYMSLLEHSLITLIFIKALPHHIFVIVDVLFSHSLHCCDIVYLRNERVSSIRTINSFDSRKSKWNKEIENFQDSTWRRLENYVNIIKCAININYSQSHIVWTFRIRERAILLIVECVPLTPRWRKKNLFVWYEQATEQINCIFHVFSFQTMNRVFFLRQRERDYPVINKNNGQRIVEKEGKIY